MINLFYLSPNPYGGWVTFTAHLYKALSMVHDKVNLYKIGNNTERKTRKFGYDVEYRNITIEDAVKLEGVNLITAMGKRFIEPAKILMTIAEANIVIHDPTELWEEVKHLVHSPIVIRSNNKKYFDNATYIAHPYVRHYDDTPVKRPKHTAVSISRIDFDKHTDILLDANRIDKTIDIFGFENRLYTKFKIMPLYPEWEQSKCAYPREMAYATELCRNYKYMVDMSAISGDGGGTQYTFLEAMDAGCVCILNEKWFISRGVMEKDENCLAAHDGASLHKVITKTPAWKRNMIIEDGYKLLRRHDPKKIARKYLKRLGL